MTVNKPQLDQEAIALGVERRRSHRVIIQVPVTLEVSISGQTVTAPAHTVAVNVHGAMLVCVRSFAAGTKLEMINLRTNERAKVHVTRPPRESAEGYLIPVEFDQESASFWQISFPASNWKPTEG